MIKTERLFGNGTVQIEAVSNTHKNARTYTCPICGKQWETVERVVACVNTCGNKQTEYLKEQRNAAHINLMISNIERSMAITKAMKDDFKKTYPISYEKIYGK